MPQGKPLSAEHLAAVRIGNRRSDIAGLVRQCEHRRSRGLTISQRTLDRINRLREEIAEIQRGRFTTTQPDQGGSPIP